MNATDPELDGTGLRALLVAGSDDLPPHIDLLRGVSERRTAARRRARRRTRAFVPAGAVATAGGVAAVITLTTSVGAPPALAAVTGAAAKTSAQSFQYSLEATMYSTLPPFSWAGTGAADPTHKLGEETDKFDLSYHPTTVTRYIGKYEYIQNWVGSKSEPWVKYPINPSLNNVENDLTGVGAEGPINPAVLLGVLRGDATVRVVGPASGPGWTGTEYAFTGRYPNPPQETASGTVFVDKQGLVRRLVITAKVTGVDPRGSYTLTEGFSFGGFGLPVQVSPPPAGEVTNPSSGPGSQR